MCCSCCLLFTVLVYFFVPFINVAIITLKKYPRGLFAPGVKDRQECGACVCEYIEASACGL
ncbi:hypothetical protein PsorP6_002359 [Peronosclerospora sorghi]|uniref:Uncharacterized protein n=1 Tax=Peronosclerospora sorghi TaxID=230839 RepID=A0ACC0WX20_9STRA|nr:hypothetical protein PsorP6_002359 [Peronosclerospora sorghi]